MARLKRFNPPADLGDFRHIPGQLEQWHEAVYGWFEAFAKSEQSNVGKGQVQFYNPAKDDPAGPLVEQVIPWNAFPKELLRSFSPQRALEEADQLWPLSRYESDYKSPIMERTPYRPQTEYCEWRVERDPATNKLLRVTFTSEPPEYWQAMFGDTLRGEWGIPWNFPFTGDRELVLRLYHELVSPEVKKEDLICTQDIASSGGKTVLVRKGGYNPFNKWNTTHGIMHLCAPPNLLSAEIELAADATVLRQDRRGRTLLEPDALICCAGYGGPDRNSDPTIGGAVNALARLGAMVTLKNPVGLYMDHLDLAGWEAPDGQPVADCVRIVRGRPGMIERLVVEVPADRGFLLGDLKIAGVPIAYGGQIASCITVNLVGMAALVTPPVRNEPIKCEGRCCIDPAHATSLDFVEAKDPLPPGTQAAFGEEGVEPAVSVLAAALETRAVRRPLRRPVRRKE